MFNLPEHLTNLVTKYCEKMNTKDVEYIISRIRKEDKNPEEVYDLKDLEWFPDEKDMQKKAPKEFQNKKKISEINKILYDFKKGDSKINNDLKNVLDNIDFTIAIRPPDQQKTPNGGMVFKKGENGEKDKAVLFIADVTFLEKNKDLLPGLLAHEMGHLLEFTKRPSDETSKTKYMDGAESFADITGELIANNSGYTSLPWAMFMNNESKKGNNPANSPSGRFRAKTIIRAKRALSRANSQQQPKSEDGVTKNSPKAGNLSKKEKINSLREISSTKKLPNITKKQSNIYIKFMNTHQNTK